MSQNGNGHNGRYTAEQFITAIPGSAAIITTIAARVGCAWHTVRSYIDKYPTVREAFEDEQQKIVDLAESVVIKAMRDDNDVGTARWYLSTRGKDRGYTERTELTGKDGGPVTFRDFDSALKRAYGTDEPT